MEPVTSRCWVRRSADPSLDSSSLSAALGIPPRAIEILAGRTLNDLPHIQAFLDSSLSDLPDPDLLPGMRQAAERVATAVINQELILVHGDYDVDGISGTALLVDFLRQSGALVDYHIPLRLRDGYGLSAQALRRGADQGCRVVVSVDCGISALDEAALAKQLGMDLVITDHHQPGAQLPEAFANVNPRLAGEDFPDRDLAGVGVAFFLAVAVRRRLRIAGHFNTRPEPDVRLLLDLAALGTIADVVPLRKVNRLLVTKGLELLSQVRRPGVKALVTASGVARLTCGSVAFQLAPRLNAAGRLEDAALGVELLLTQDAARATELAEQLDLFNRERREIEQATLDQALSMVAQLPEALRSIVLWDASWHPGVIGIVASRLVERFHRPTLLIACEGDEAKGSARSIPGFHLYEALSQCSSVLGGYGGHAAAAGFSLPSSRLPDLAQVFEEVCQGCPDLVATRPTLHYDLDLEVADCDLALAAAMERFAPFGAGNAEPLICLREVQAQQVQPLSGGHLRFTARQYGESLPCIAFSMAERTREFSESIDLLASVQVNRWNGRQQVQLVVKDVRPAEGGRG